MSDLDGIRGGKPHTLEASKAYIMSWRKAAQLDDLFLLLDPSVTKDVQDHHYVFNSVITIARALSS